MENLQETGSPPVFLHQSSQDTFRVIGSRCETGRQGLWLDGVLTSQGRQILDLEQHGVLLRLQLVPHLQESHQLRVQVLDILAERSTQHRQVLDAVVLKISEVQVSPGGGRVRGLLVAPQSVPQVPQSVPEASRSGLGGLLNSWRNCVLLGADLQPLFLFFTLTVVDEAELKVHLSLKAGSERQHMAVTGPVSVLPALGAPPSVLRLPQ